MAEWRHVLAMAWGRGPLVCEPCVRERVAAEACTTPTPDPTSPCGRSFDKAMSVGSFGCLFPADHEIHDEARARHAGWRFHPHQPTRCTCGHPITKEEKP